MPSVRKRVTGFIRQVDTHSIKLSGLVNYLLQFELVLFVNRKTIEIFLDGQFDVNPKMLLIRS